MGWYTKGLTRSILFALLLAFFSNNAHAQYMTGFITEHNRNRIQQAVDNFVASHRYKVGIFRIRPQLSIGAGFSTNNRYGSVNNNNKPDLFITIIPGISGGVKFGNRAFFRVSEDYTFRWQATRKDLQYNHGATIGEFVTGSEKVLLKLDGSYARRTQPVNEEIDVPVDNTYTTFRASVEYAISSRIGLRHGVGYTTNNFHEVVSGDTIPLQDRKTLGVFNGISYNYSERVQFTGDVVFSRSEAVQQNITTNRVGTLFGMNYRRTKFDARAAVGFGYSTDPNADRSRKDFILDANASYLLGRASHIGFSAHRLQEFSFLQSNAVRTTTSFGVNYMTPLFSRLSFYASANTGINDYGDQIIGGQPVQNDTFQTADVGLSLHIWKAFSVNGGLYYTNRNTDLTGLNQKHFNYYFGFGGGYTVNIADLFF